MKKQYVNYPFNNTSLILCSTEEQSSTLMQQGEEIGLFMSSVMWTVWAEDCTHHKKRKYSTHHKRRQSNFVRLLHIIFFITFRSGSGSGYYFDYRQVMFHMLMILMKFSFIPQACFRIFFFFRIRIRILPWNLIEKVMLNILKILTKCGVALQNFVKIKILFRIRIRIMILLWISIPDLHFIHRRHPPNFVWIH